MHHQNIQEKLTCLYITRCILITLMKFKLYLLSYIVIGIDYNNANISLVSLCVKLKRFLFNFFLFEPINKNECDILLHDFQSNNIRIKIQRLHSDVYPIILYCINDFSLCIANIERAIHQHYSRCCKNTITRAKTIAPQTMRNNLHNDDRKIFKSINRSRYTL